MVFPVLTSDLALARGHSPLYICAFAFYPASLMISALPSTRWKREIKQFLLVFLPAIHPPEIAISQIHTSWCAGNAKRVWERQNGNRWQEVLNSDLASIEDRMLKGWDDLSLALSADLAEGRKVNQRNWGHIREAEIGRGRKYYKDLFTFEGRRARIFAF